MEASNSFVEQQRLCNRHWCLSIGHDKSRWVLLFFFNYIKKKHLFLPFQPFLSRASHFSFYSFFLLFLQPGFFSAVVLASCPCPTTQAFMLNNTDSRIKWGVCRRRAHFTSKFACDADLSENNHPLCIYIYVCICCKIFLCDCVNVLRAHSYLLIPLNS